MLAPPHYASVPFPRISPCRRQRHRYQDVLPVPCLLFGARRALLPAPDTIAPPPPRRIPRDAITLKPCTCLQAPYPPQARAPPPGRDTNAPIPPPLRTALTHPPNPTHSAQTTTAQQQQPSVLACRIKPGGPLSPSFLLLWVSASLRVHLFVNRRLEKSPPA